MYGRFLSGLGCCQFVVGVGGMNFLGLPAQAWIVLSIGGALGALCRGLLVLIWLDGGASNTLVITLLMNAIGSLVLGAWMPIVQLKIAKWPSLLVFVPAFCGGLTTFSGLTADLLNWILAGQLMWVMVWMLVSAWVSVGCLAIGWWGAQAWQTQRHQSRKL